MFSSRKIKRLLSVIVLIQAYLSAPVFHTPYFWSLLLWKKDCVYVMTNIWLEMKDIKIKLKVMFVGYQNITYALTIATMHSILCIFFKSSSSLLYVCNFRSNSLRVSFLGKIKLIIIVHHLVKISGFLIRIYIFFL